MRIHGEPVRVATLVLALAVIGVSVWSDAPVAQIIAEVTALVAVMERLRRLVAPMSSVLLHIHDRLDPTPPRTGRGA